MSWPHNYGLHQLSVSVREFWILPASHTWLCKCLQQAFPGTWLLFWSNATYLLHSSLAWDLFFEKYSECCWTRPLWHRSCCLGKWWDVANGPQIFAAVAAAARVHCLLSLRMFRRLYMPVSRWKSKISRWAVAIEYASSMSWPEVFYLSIPSETSVFVFKTGLIWPVFTFYSVSVISEHLSWRNQKKNL